MKEIKLKGGLSVPLFGSVEKFKVEDLEPKFIGILSEDYFGLKPKFLASEGDLVRVGQPIVEDKTNQGFKIVSPVSGVISSVNRGEKRALISVEIENDKKNTLFFRSTPSAASRWNAQRLIPGGARSMTHDF